MLVDLNENAFLRDSTIKKLGFCFQSGIIKKYEWKMRVSVEWRRKELYHLSYCFAQFCEKMPRIMLRVQNNFVEVLAFASLSLLKTCLIYNNKISIAILNCFQMYWNSNMPQLTLYDYSIVGNFQGNSYFPIFQYVPFKIQNELFSHGHNYMTVESPAVRNEPQNILITSPLNGEAQQPAIEEKPEEKGENDIEAEEDFELNIKTNSLKIYRKKNTESNIVNQAFSFLTCPKSKSLLRKIINEEFKINQFYSVINKIKKKNKKYINRHYLSKILEFGQKSQFARVFSKVKNLSISVLEMRQSIRRLLLYFFKDYSFLCLLTSNKIYKQTLKQHFWRKRQIEEFLFEKEMVEVSD